jgi:hypothetical protein
MKKLFLLITVCFFLVNCKMIAKGAARYWTKKQIKEFVADCKIHSGKLMSEEKAEQFCDCAVDEIAEKYQNYEDIQKAGIAEVLKAANNCRKFTGF